MSKRPAILLLCLASCSSDPPAPPDLGRDAAPGDLAPREGPRLDAPRADQRGPDTTPRPPAKWVDVAGAPPLIYHTATLLKDGRVLIVGGERREAANQTKLLPEAFLFDPASGGFSAGGSLAAPRARHTATLLADGRVLVVGGAGESGAPALLATELFDPAKPIAQAWSAGPPLPSAREDHTAVTLPDGKLLIAGGTGSSGGALSSILLLDPAAGTWTVPIYSKLNLGRSSHCSVALADGRVLFAGGYDGKVFLASLEVLQPKSGAVTTLPSTLSEGRSKLTCHPLPDGRVLLLGGWRGFTASVTANAIFDPKTDQLASISHLGDAPGFHAGVALQDGRVLAIGGVTSPAVPNGVDTVVAFDAKTGWQAMPSLAHGRFRLTATLLGDGSVLVVGGTPTLSSAYVGIAERLTP